jgi:hypothetical protein
MKKILFALFLASIAGTSMAQQTPGAAQEAAWYKGYLVTRLAKFNDPTAAEDPTNIPADEQNPIYTIFRTSPFGPIRQPDPVVDFVPGDVGYSAWWQSRLLIDYTGRDYEQDPWTSEAEIEAALCPYEGAPAIGQCLFEGLRLIDITSTSFLANFGPVNAQIINAPPVLNFCPPAR